MHVVTNERMTMQPELNENGMVTINVSDDVYDQIESLRQSPDETHAQIIKRLMGAYLLDKQGYVHTHDDQT